MLCPERLQALKCRVLEIIDSEALLDITYFCLRSQLIVAWDCGFRCYF